MVNLPHGESRDIELPLDVRYFIKFSEARLQAVSSRNMYSLHGLEALMRAVFLHVCQRLTVVCTACRIAQCTGSATLPANRGRAAFHWAGVGILRSTNRGRRGSAHEIVVTRTE